MSVIVDNGGIKLFDFVKELKFYFTVLGMREKYSLQQECNYGANFVGARRFFNELGNRCP